MGGRSCVPRSKPGAGHVKKGRLFLGTGERYAEVILLSAAQRGGKCHIAQRLLDLILAQGHGVDAIPPHGFFLGRQELHRADAVTSNRREQVKGIGGARLEARTDAAADLSAVRQQVVEVVLNRRTAQLAVHGHGQ